ncbi:MAG: UPF0280 family protein [Desulfobacterales bacterium]
MKNYQPRDYRKLVKNNRLSFFKAVVKETDLAIYAEKPMEAAARELILKQRGYLEAYIERYPDFADTLLPWPLLEPAPKIVRDMVWAGHQAGVGPMAAVAGAVAEHVGQGLLKYSPEVIVENGGDVFLKTDGPSTVAVYAGKSPFSLRIGIRIFPENSPVSVCTSSGTVGHSKSMGKADAVCVISRSCSLADAVATSIGNHVSHHKDIQKGIEFGKQVQDIQGIVVIVGKKIGAWGNLEIVEI